MNFMPYESHRVHVEHHQSILLAEVARERLATQAGRTRRRGAARRHPVRLADLLAAVAGRAQELASR